MAATHHGELRRRGWTVNAKRVYRLLREDNLLCVRKRKFVVTTNSTRAKGVPESARAMVLTGVNQLWRADITYIGCARSSFPGRDSGRIFAPCHRWALDRNMKTS